MLTFLWQLSTHGLLSQNEFLQILREDATLNGLVKATLEITQSPIIANAVKIFSTLALVTSFLGVALGLLECIEDLLKQSFNIHAGRISLGLMTFIPPVLFSLFYPEGFILALGYAGQMFAFYAVVLPVALVWKARSIHPNLPYRVWGGKALLVLVLVLGVIITSIPFAIREGYLPLLWVKMNEKKDRTFKVRSFFICFHINVSLTDHSNIRQYTLAQLLGSVFLTRL